MGEAGEFAAGSHHRIHVDDINDFLHGLLGHGHRDIVIAVDTEKFFSDGDAMTDVTIIRLSDHYDQRPLEMPCS